MNLKDRINQDLKQAMKDGASLKKNVIRMILSEIKYAETSKSGLGNGDTEVEKVLKSYHKKLSKAMEEFTGEKRNELQLEVNIVEEYLPKQASEAEINKAIDEVFASTDQRDVGPLTGLVMKKLKNADGKIVNQLLRARL